FKYLSYNNQETHRMIKQSRYVLSVLKRMQGVVQLLITLAFLVVSLTLYKKVEMLVVKSDSGISRSLRFIF
ncbi:MAG: hypothetical protein K2K25_07395, partial [Muribaculaceae bacterium]|nr:hypothetical protein [Muribaculaceae bacterium]